MDGGEACSITTGLVLSCRLLLRSQMLNRVCFTRVYVSWRLPISARAGNAPCVSGFRCSLDGRNCNNRAIQPLGSSHCDRESRDVRSGVRKYPNQSCSGVMLHVRRPTALSARWAAVMLIKLVRDTHPELFNGPKLSDARQPFWRKAFGQAVRHRER